MLILAIDTATANVVAGIVEFQPPPQRGAPSSNVVAQRSIASGNRHAETLGQLIPELQKLAAVTMTELHAIVVGLGPGPFTGLRVGIMTAAAFGDALSVPVYGVCTHDAIARAYLVIPELERQDAPVTGDGFAVVTDARRRECYWTGYDKSGQRVTGPHVQRPDDVLAHAEWPVSGPVIGDPSLSEALAAVIRPADPTPSGLALAAQGRIEGQDQAPLTPLYLRRPDAMPPGARKLVTPA